MNDQNKNTHLLDDEDFVRLMEQNYKAQGEPVDRVSKQRVWSGLQDELALSSKPAPPSWLGVLIAAGLLLGVLSPALWKIENHVDEYTRIKGEEPLLEAVLSIYSWQQDGGLELVEDTISPGETLVFKSRVAQQAHVALLSQKIAGVPEVRFVGSEAAPGDERLLTRQGKAYGYTVQRTDKELSFCLVAAGQKHELYHLLDQVSHVFGQVGPVGCQTVSVIGGED